MFKNKFFYLSAIFFALSVRGVWADETPIDNGLSGISSNSMLDSFIGNYMGFSQLGSYLISLFVALILAIVIAFHPQTYGRRATIEDIEAPKTLIFYALIDSLVGATVADYGPELEFIFSSPSQLNRESIEAFLDRHIANDNRGTVAWNI